MTFTTFKAIFESLNYDFSLKNSLHSYFFWKRSMQSCLCTFVFHVKYIYNLGREEIVDFLY